MENKEDTIRNITDAILCISSATHPATPFRVVHDLLARLEKMRAELAPPPATTQESDDEVRDI